MLLAPLEALSSQFVDTERARSCGEAACGNYRGISVPVSIVDQEFRVLHCREWRKLVSLGWLSVDPAQRFHVFQVRMLRTLMRKRDVLVATNLRNKNDSSDFFDLRVFRRGHAVHETCNLDS